MKLLLASAVVVLLAVVGTAQTFALRCDDGEPATQGEAPLSTDVSLRTADGKAVNLSEFRGTPLILNFWATWCAPCRRELPWLVAIQKRYASRGLRVVGISMDDSDNPQVRQVTSEANVSYQLLFGDLDSAMELVGAQGIPATLFIDRNGKVLHRSIGILNQEELERHAQELLKEVR